MSANRNLSRREFIKIAGIAIGGLGLARCGGTQGARQELKGSTINYLGWEGYDYAGALKPLTDEHSIKVNSTYGANNEEIFSKLKASSGGQYDVVSIYHGVVEAMVKNDLLQPVDVSRLVNWKDTVEFFHNQPWQVYDGKVYSVPFTWGGDQVIYNPKYIPEGIQSYKDILKPEYQGKVGILDNKDMFYYALRSNGVDITKQITKDQLQGAKEYFLELKANARAIVPNNGELADMFAREEIWITGPVGWPAILPQVKEKGVELVAVTPKEGGVGWCDNYVIPKSPTNLAGSYAFIDQMISPEGQAELANYLNQDVVNPKVKDLLPPEKQADYDDLEGRIKSIIFPPPQPLEPDDPNIASLEDWVNLWEEVKAA